MTVGRVLTPHVSASSLLVREPEDGESVYVVPPAEVVHELNRRFPMEGQNGLYFTMAYGVLNLETLEFRFATAGHDPIVHVPKSGVPQFVEGDGMAVGWVDDMEYDEFAIQLQPGDRLYLYSDGVPEAMSPEMEQFTMEQMLEIIELGKARPLKDSAALLLSSVKRWCGEAGPQDDVSILGIEIADEEG